MAPPALLDPRVAAPALRPPAPAAPRPARVAPALHAHHVRRLEAAVDFVDAHLDEALGLERLAAVAAMSPFHFHRLFHAWAGETLSDFVRRRRLEVAAGRLRHCPDETVTAIALGCGFSSPELFARVFRDHFGSSPSQWRRLAGGAHTPAGPGIGAAAVRIVHEAPCDVLFMRARGDFRDVAPALWTRFANAVQMLDLGGRPLLTMGLDDPTITAAPHCRLDVCVALPCASAAPAALPLLQRHLPARRVATLAYEGPAAGIAAAWRALLDDWLPQAPFQLAIGAFFERYDPADGHPGGASVRCLLGMPVEPRAA